MASTAPLFNDNLNIIQALTDEPNDQDGLTAEELKAKFDEAGIRIKDYLNNKLRPYINGVNQNLKDLEEAFLEGSDAGLAYENHLDNRTAIALLLNYARQLDWNIKGRVANDLLDQSTALSLLLNYARQNAWSVGRGTVTLTNSSTFPFNNSRRTVALGGVRDSTDYVVLSEIVSANGNPGEIEVTDKLDNGFKLGFTGSAKSVTVNYTVFGGDMK